MAQTQVTTNVIADEAIDEAKMQISNAGTNGQVLSKQSGNTGGLTWATVSAVGALDSGSITSGFGSIDNGSSAITTTGALTSGTVDGIVGSVTPAAGTFTTITGNTSLALATGATVTGILDEDAMNTNSATQLATQQSIKAYVDASGTSVGLLLFYGAQA